MPTDLSRDAPDDEPAEGPRAGRLSPLGLTLRLAVASAMIAGLSLYARRAARGPAPVAAAEPFVPAAAAAVPALPALAAARLGLTEPGLDPVRVGPGRIDPATGAREDTLSRGAFAALEAPALRLTLTRGPQADRAPGLFVLLARRAAGMPGSDDVPALAVMRTGAYGRVATKFGAVETVEVTLGGALRRTCTGFVTRESALRIDGWLCAPLGRPPEPRALACTLDALSLDDPADPAASAAFRGSEARRAPGCDRPSAAADPAGRTGSIIRQAARPKK